MLPDIFLATYDSVLEDPFSSFKYGFTQSDCLEPELILPNSPTSSQNPITSSSGYDKSVEPNWSDQNTPKSNPLSDGSDFSASTIDERKRKRKISNRESARRSRMRKQKHMEDLRNQVSRIRVENRDLLNQLRVVSYHFHRICTENNRIQLEHNMWRQKLLNIRGILVSEQLGN